MKLTFTNIVAALSFLAALTCLGLGIYYSDNSVAEKFCMGGLILLLLVPIVKITEGL